MEYIRGFIVPLMQFHAKVSMPNSDGIADALTLWSQLFQTRQIKAVTTLMGSLMKDLVNSKSNINFFKDKASQIKHLGDYIRRLYTKIDTRFSKIGTDSNLCHRSTFSLKYKPSDINGSFRSYIEQFCDRDNHRHCGLKKFRIHHQKNINDILSYDSSISNVPKDGFDSIRNSLKEINENSEKPVTCTCCSKIGDAIIALQSPKDFTLEYVDNAFKYLAQILQKPNKQHPSEIKINS